jgi:calcineurin-like phosphoesterase family protein
MIYFTADLHFGHERVIEHCNRPFASTEEMNATLIRNWNEVVAPKDEVYILGDFTMMHGEAAHHYLTLLNGRKYFIRGNHDRFLNTIDSFGNHFEWVKDYYVLKQNNRQFVLFHYPIAEWYGYFRGAIHLYGHVHNSPISAARLNISGLAFNVGVDCNGFRPVSIEEIIAMADEKEIIMGETNSIHATALHELEPV